MLVCYKKHGWGRRMLVIDSVSLGVGDLKKVRVQVPQITWFILSFIFQYSLVLFWILLVVFILAREIVVIKVPMFFLCLWQPQPVSPVIFRIFPTEERSPEKSFQHKCESLSLHGIWDGRYHRDHNNKMLWNLPSLNWNCEFYRYDTRNPSIIFLLEVSRS